MSKKIPVTRSSMPEFEEYISEIKDLWDSHWLTNMGVKHQKLEAELLKYLEVPYITLFSNGHLALESAISAFHLMGEVITTPFTFASTTHAIVRCGLKPVFCDINPDDFTIDVEKLESLITENTTAILPVHVYGNPCDVMEIDRIAKKNNLIVIYDAAHAFGITINGVGIGSFGDASMFSFHATKVFNTIEGGAVTLNDYTKKVTLDKIKNFGITNSQSVELVGTNSKMNEFQAAMGICNLRHIDEEIKKRKNVYERYMERLYNVKGLYLCASKTGANRVKMNYSYFPVVFNEKIFSRDKIHEYLAKNQIFSRKYFSPLTSSFECYKGYFSSGQTPIAQCISDNILTLPLYSDLTINDVDRICDTLLDCI